MSSQKAPIDVVAKPFLRLIQNEKYGGLVLGMSIILALIVANSPWQQTYHDFFSHQFGFQFDGKSYFEFSILNWINDGLMAIFFFVIGLELKREIVAGELSHPRNALLPIAAAIGGIVVPALIYILLNPTGEVNDGWGIPMATDIALALGVLYLLGERIPITLKVFLTALAIVDDIGAVLVIAFFYTSEISMISLLLGFIFLMVMFIGNRLGIRSIAFYAIIGIGGVWTAFLLSGIHATIAAVLAAFMIPADVKIKEDVFIARIKKHLYQFLKADPDDSIPTVTKRQLFIMERINLDVKRALTPLQRLEYGLHPLVNFVILPIFAFANAGVTFLDININELFSTNVALGVALGLLLGKVIGIVGFSWLCARLNIAPFPKELNIKTLIGLGFIASIGFTMSLFITQLAFTHELYESQAKVGILTASIIGGVLGYFFLRRTTSKQSTSFK